MLSQSLQTVFVLKYRVPCPVFSLPLNERFNCVSATLRTLFANASPWLARFKVVPVPSLHTLSDRPPRALGTNLNSFAIELEFVMPNLAVATFEHTHSLHLDDVLNTTIVPAFQYQILQVILAIGLRYRVPMLVVQVAPIVARIA
jgi:hypothetical protein